MRAIVYDRWMGDGEKFFFPRTANAHPPRNRRKNVRVSVGCAPRSTGNSWPTFAVILRRDKSSPRQQQKRDFSSVENIRGLIRRRSVSSSPENYSCSVLGKHDVKRFSDDKLLTLSRSPVGRGVERDDQQIWDVYCESGASKVSRILLKWICMDTLICIRGRVCLSSNPDDWLRKNASAPRHFPTRACICMRQSPSWRGI